MTNDGTRGPAVPFPGAPAGPARVVIESIAPQVAGGRYPAKRCIGDSVTVTAQVVADGHDVLAAVVRYRHGPNGAWGQAALKRTNPGLDLWTGEFSVDALGEWEFAVTAWIDPFRSWLAGLRARVAANQDISVAREQGALLIEDIAAGASKGNTDADSLLKWARALRTASGEAAVSLASNEELLALIDDSFSARDAVSSDRRIVSVDPVCARFSSWYEFFPRSTGAEGVHGTFATALERLRYAADMGFDVVYLPPIHPIGYANRKGRDNAVAAEPGDPGSPWAIGSPEGGHTSVHPALGTLADFRKFLAEGRRLGVEVALDIAFQCAPDHPLVSEHPEWFRHLPDGSIAHAENPPKRYEDIVPFDFECEDWRGLWDELLGTVLFWIAEGVRIFRVDNPHTKPLPFWEWLIASVRAEHPDVVFLAEAFARPALVHGLAQRGFNQSYTYFAWRNTREELETYLTELTRGPGQEYLRPNLWPNTPDILTEYLQAGGRPAAIIRFVLAATLSASYGIYGPVFELGENVAVRPGSEEYLHSEKYELRHWDTESAWSIREIITRVNGLRKAMPALQRNDTLTFHATSNDRLICYSKRAPGSENLVVVVVNLDPHYAQSGTIVLDEAELGIEFAGQYLANDLLAGGSYVWEGRENYVQLDPFVSPAHIFELRRHRRTERDFDYFF